ncbi:class I SAM-dependent methyltransferase [Streptomyces griseoaurantiacus]|uniref:Methyltransferase domain-containing protein n=1 Tax=Streptomyces griseoaurantiacus TaxID=68213 RepID=A0A1G7MES2_9ACTN|nr:class I SAM-dependent methyltransferase [Streptomyces jietaisiensis]SDF59690.1 Methyltransferase domain-containing protein [Streptomyces jietaisiensis]
MTHTTPPSPEEIAREWHARARREGLARVMRAQQPPELGEAVTEETRRTLARLLKRAGQELPEGIGTVLEIGCGIGRLTPTLAAAARRVAALDMTPGMLESARTACADLDHVSLHLLRAQDLTLEDVDRLVGRPADVTVCVWVLMHLLDDAELAALFRTLSLATRHLLLIEYERAAVPVGRFSRLRPLSHFLDLLPGSRVLERHELDYGGDRSFAALVDTGLSGGAR